MLKDTFPYDAKAEISIRGSFKIEKCDDFIAIYLPDWWIPPSFVSWGKGNEGIIEADINMESNQLATAKPSRTIKPPMK